MISKPLLGIFALLLALPVKGQVTQAIGEDTTTLSNWRTSAALEADSEYGTSGYLLYGFDDIDGQYRSGFDATTSGAEATNQVSLPAFITEVALPAGSPMWSGNGNVGQIQDPNAGNALANTSILANGADPAVFTITRANNAAFRLTILLSDVDGENNIWNSSVNAGAAGSAAITGATANGVQNTTYHVYDIAAGTDPITVTTDNTGPPVRVTGFAFDLLAASTISAANDDFATTDLLASIDIDVLANDSSTGAVTALQVVTGPSSGTAVPQGGSSILYTHTTGTPASDSFVYRFNDDNGWSTTATVTVTLTAPPLTLSEGTVIGMNLLSGGNSAEAKWNNFSSFSSIAAGSVIDWDSSTVISGVSIALTGSGGFADDGASEGWATTDDPYYVETDSLNDIQFGSGSDLTISGLDAGLQYNVRIYSLIGNSPTVTDGFSINGGTLATSTRGDRWSSSSPVIFANQTLNGSGDLVIHADVAGEVNTFWNAVIVEAVAPVTTVADDFATTDLLLSVDIDVLANDFSTGAVTALQVVSGPGSGTAVPQGTTSILYTHTTGTPPSDSFTYRFNDDNGWSDTATVTVTLTVPPVADPGVTYEGAITDLSDWRTSSVSKPLDSDGDDIIGTLGYNLFGVGGGGTSLSSLPSYVTVTKNVPNEFNSAGYADIDNPADGGATNIDSGTTSDAGTGGAQRIATVTFGAGAPSSLGMTLMHDNLDGTPGQYTVPGYEVRSADGTTVLATATGTNSNNSPDWLFLTLTGILEGAEIQIWGTGGTHPTLSLIAFDEIVLDTDGDGLPDEWELAQTGVTDLSDLDGTIATTSGSGSGSGDFDGDGLVDAGEYNGGVDSADAGDPDSDGDGLLDGVETRTGTFVSATDTGTSPNLVDTDGDTLSDFDEVTIHGTDPNNKDTDGDELTDADELVRGTYAITADSDGDGSVDGAEVLFGTDPNSASSTPDTNQVLAGLVGPGSVGKFFDSVLPLTTPLISTGDSWTRVTALPSVSFSDAMGLVPEPGTNNMIVYERGGRLQQVDYNAATTTKTQIMDMSSLVNASGLGGLMTMVLHPEYNQGGSPNKDYLYVFYTTSATAARGFTNPDNSLFIRVSRFTRDPNTGTVPLNTEQVLIQQKFAPVGFSGFVHIAGGMTFGSDGFLYISWGDNEHAPNNVVPGVPFYQDAQRVDRVFQCSTIAIDVDSQGGGVSTAPIRALQGNTGPNAIAGASQSCPPSHPWYHADNHSGVGYYIPKTNYFHGDNYSTVAGTAGTSQGYIYNQHDVSSNRSLVNYNYDAHGDALEEHVAVGLRNSWKMCADPMDGDIAMFEVGSNSNDRSKNFEEFNVIEFGQQGGNYGWPYREGDQLQEYETGVTKGPGGDSGVPVYLGVETDPVFAYSHTTSPGGRSASGGVFYYGTSLSSLPGKLIGGDHDGTIWSVDYKGGGTPVVNHILESGTNIRQMALSPDGEDILWVSAGQVHRLVDVSSTTPPAPATLSATGAFADLATLEPRAGMFSFEPIAPLWSDRAAKYRYLALPNAMGVDGEYDLADEKITFSENGNWGFPQGTVLVKHFSLPLDEGDPENPALLYKVETRFLVHGDDGEYYGFTYRWRDDQTEADLIPPGDTSSYATTVMVTREDDSTYIQTWDFPTRTQCFECHQAASGFVLGLRSRQLNGSLDYATTSASNSGVLGAFQSNQLMTLDQLDALDQDITVSEIVNYLTSANISDETATLEHRVFSYLDSNCASCHQPNGASGRADFDALLTTPFELKNLVGSPPQAGSLGLIDPEIVKPGDPLNSLLYHRDASVNTESMMPPLAKTIEDATYLAVLYKWIERIGYENFDAHATAHGVIGGLFDDDDGDGLVNGLEFYLGTDLAEPTLDPGYTVQQVGGAVHFQIPVNGDAVEDGITPIVSDSVNLLDWFEAGTPGSILTLHSDTSGVGVSGIQSWEVLPGNPEGFFRLGLSN